MKRRNWLLWGIIAASALVIIVTNFITTRAAARSNEGGGVDFDIRCRYVVGAQTVMQSMGQSAAGPSLASQLAGTADNPLDRLRLIPVLGQVQGDDAAAKALDDFLKSNPTEGLAKDARILQKIYPSSGKSLSPDEEARLRDRHGWFGDLAVSATRPASDPLRAAVLSRARRTVYATLSMFAIGIVSLVFGLVLLIVGIVKLTSGQLPSRFRPAEPNVGDALLLGFTVYLSMMMLLGVTVHYIIHATNFNWNFVLFLPPIGAFFAVRNSGVSWAQLRAALGLHRGRGILVEMFTGIVGYITGVPVLALGAIITLILTHYTGVTATHPVTRELVEPGYSRVLIFFLACVFAPVVEEMMFRGMLLGNLRLRLHWLISALLTALIFASIHPQGLVGIPVLAAIAMMLAGLREQRDCIIASMTAHALNNAFALTIVILAAG
jgi:membrane protease YdiL (CAAX protease family)